MTLIALTKSETVGCIEVLISVLSIFTATGGFFNFRPSPKSFAPSKLSNSKSGFLIFIVKVSLAIVTGPIGISSPAIILSLFISIIIFLLNSEFN